MGIRLIRWVQSTFFETIGREQNYIQNRQNLNTTKMKTNNAINPKDQLTEKNSSLLQSFKTFLQVRNYRGHSRLYVQPIEEYLAWTQRRGMADIKAINNSDVIFYHEYLASRPNRRRGGTLSDSSINKHLFALKIFYAHLLEQKMILKPLIIPNRSDKTRMEKKILSVDEVKQLYKACANQFQIALLSVVYGCGLRRTEIQQLNASDILFSQGMLIVKSGKGGKRREVPMSDKIVSDLRTYLLGERNDRLALKRKRVNAFFVTRQTGRATGGHLNRILKEIAQRTESQEIIDKNITLHALRHTIATHLADNGASMDFIRDFLGHSLMDTSQIYALKRKKNQIFKV